VVEAIDRGVAYLKNSLNSTTGARRGRVRRGTSLSLGYASLAGLTLLECGVPGTDEQIQQAARSVRQLAADDTATYSLAVAILFLDRLKDNQDESLIQTLALRLIANQGEMGGWDYTSQLISANQQQELLGLLQSDNPDIQNVDVRIRSMPLWTYQPGQQLTRRNVRREDNSLTQFAILALWRAQKHGVKAERCLAMAEARFRACQAADGSWAYNWGGSSRKHSMTCAGLLGLAVGRGVARRDGSKNQGGQPARSLTDDEQVKKGFDFLVREIIGRPADRSARARRRGRGTLLRADSWGDLYFLWSLERVAMIYSLKEIGGKDWYDWGWRILVASQHDDGQWKDAFPGVVDTSFALLFLKRANLAKDLTAKLQLGN
jgi:hypothetical protein